jgi:hypothetical protein
MGTVAPGCASLIYQPQVGFVDQVGALEAARGSFPAHMTRGDLPQLMIGQLQQARLGLGLAIVEGAEKTGYLATALALHEFLEPGSPTGEVKYKNLSVSYRSISKVFSLARHRQVVEDCITFDSSPGRGSPMHIFQTRVPGFRTRP